MGSLNLPNSGNVYIDANIVLYSVDVHPVYFPICLPVWESAQSGAISVVSSELILVETLVGPLRSEDALLFERRKSLWDHENISLLPITRDILMEAARLRAAIPGLKTPDAIHVATAIICKCALFISNDVGFRRIPNLPLVLLDDVLASN